MNITCGLMISQDRNLIRLIGAMLRIRTALYSNLYRPNRLENKDKKKKKKTKKKKLQLLFLKKKKKIFFFFFFFFFFCINTIIFIYTIKN